METKTEFASHKPVPLNCGTKHTTGSTVRGNFIFTVFIPKIFNLSLQIVFENIYTNSFGAYVPSKFLNFSFKNSARVVVRSLVSVFKTLDQIAFGLDKTINLFFARVTAV